MTTRILICTPRKHLVLGRGPEGKNRLGSVCQCGKFFTAPTANGANEVITLLRTEKDDSENTA